MSIEVPVTRLSHGAHLPLPAYATPGSAGLDLMAAIAEPILLAPMARLAVPTGLAIALPTGWEAQIRPRSGWALKEGVTVLNAPGTVDADYRGEIKVILVNLGQAAVAIDPGQRIAQMIVAPVASLAWKPVDSLDETGRGSGGFGSTGRG